MRSLCQNPHYAKLGHAGDTLKKCVQELDGLTCSNSTPFIGAELRKAAGDVVKLAHETVSVTFAIYRLVGTIPAFTITAVRKKQSEDFKQSMKEKLGSKHALALQRMLGPALNSRLEDLIAGKSFEPVTFKAEANAGSAT
jgi:hypothetical protein